MRTFWPLPAELVSGIVGLCVLGAVAAAMALLTSAVAFWVYDQSGFEGLSVMICATWITCVVSGRGLKAGRTPLQ